MHARQADPTPATDGAGGAVPLRWLGAAAAAVTVHPSLWATAARQALALARPGWWRRPPFVPVPAAGYLRFRLETAYGGRGDRRPPPGDLLTYLRWCRSARRWRRPLGD